MKIKELKIGIVGAGGFSAFAINAFLKIKGIKIVAVTDVNKKAANKMANDFHLKVESDISNLLKNANVELVYIATPPFLHYEQSKLALLAGKHVICEKPAALKTKEAEELRSLANEKNLLYVVNLMQRYNPLFDKVNSIIQHKILGDFLHGFFENYASDENLPSDHWFWDKTKSGGIFIEHGVHFFDLFSGWLGKGEVVNSLEIQRPFTKNIVDRVQATVLYNNSPVNFYHGFDQPKILDRQEMRLEFERGEITLYEWVPVKMKLHGLVTTDQLAYLRKIIGDGNIVFNDDVHTKSKKVKGRFTAINFDNEITLESGNIEDKQKRYQELVTNMLIDQWKWINDHHHQRKIDADNAVESLRMAEQASKIAQTF